MNALASLKGDGNYIGNGKESIGFFPNVLSECGQVWHQEKEDMKYIRLSLATTRLY